MASASAAVNSIRPSDGRVGPRLLSGQIGDPPGDPGAAVDVADARKGGAQARPRAAGNGCRRARWCRSRSPSGASNIGRAAPRTASTLASSPRSLASASSTSSGEPWRMTVQSAANSRGEIVDIGLAHRRLGAEHADHAAFRHFGRRLDRRDGADHRQVERRADMVERDGRGGVAGDDGQARVEALDQPAEQRGNARGEFGLALACRRGSRRCRRHRRSARWAAASRVGPSTDSPPTPESKNRIGASASTRRAVA